MKEVNKGDEEIKVTEKCVCRKTFLKKRNLWWRNGGNYFHSVDSVHSLKVWIFFGHKLGKQTVWYLPTAIEDYKNRICFIRSLWVIKTTVIIRIGSLVPVVCLLTRDLYLCLVLFKKKNMEGNGLIFHPYIPYYINPMKIGGTTFL